MTVDYMELIEQSDTLGTELVALEVTALDQLDDVELRKEQLQKKKAFFYTNEHVYEVPGGPGLKWNDKRRDAFIAEEYTEEVEAVIRTEGFYRKTQSEIKIVGIKISALNRKIRLLELITSYEARTE
jgi:hypothetical protein